MQILLTECLETKQTQVFTLSCSTFLWKAVLALFFCTLSKIYLLVETQAVVYYIPSLQDKLPSLKKKNFSGMHLREEALGLDEVT